MTLIYPGQYSEERALLSDRVWRLSNLYYIKNKEGKRVLFQPNWAQKELLKPHFLNIILKARQLGITTFHALLFLDACLFNNDIHAAIIADAKVVAKEIFVDKVKYAYDNLPDVFKTLCPAQRDNANEIRFANGSVFRVGTSLRGGTTQLLHITEFAKICQENPRKANEIMSGAINTVQAGQFITIESTARGRDGHFYNLCRQAMAFKDCGVKLGILDWKFWFFPWWQEKLYSLEGVEQGDIMLTQEQEAYFADLESKGIKIDDEQKAWYVKKAASQGEYMTREYPSTPEESFNSANEGLIFGKQMTSARLEKRMCHLPYDSHAKVFSAWDIGWNDETAIWVFQLVGKEIHMIDYYENQMEDLSHYANWIKSRGYHFEKHYLPHDAKAKRAETGKCFADFARAAGLNVTVLDRISNELIGVELARSMFTRCFFDERKCATGLKALDNFRKEYNEKLGTYRDRTLHDHASHGSKAFIYACQASAMVSNGAGLSAEQWQQVMSKFVG